MVTGTRVLLYPKLSIEYQKVLRLNIITPSAQPSFELWTRQSIGLKSAFSQKQSIFKNQLKQKMGVGGFFSKKIAIGTYICVSRVWVQRLLGI